MRCGRLFQKTPYSLDKQASLKENPTHLQEDRPNESSGPATHLPIFPAATISSASKLPIRRILMKSKILRTGLLIIFATTWGVITATPAQACSMADAAGKWAFTDSGTVVGVGPRAAVGVFVLDADGTLRNGKATSSLNGSVAEETFYGSYTVHANCTGKIAVKIFSSGVEILDVTMDIAFDDSMNEVRALFTSVTEPNGTSLSTVISLQARKQ
jgi:hypothetical protein